MKHIIKIAIAILIAGAFACEKDNNIDDSHNDDNNQDIDSILYNSEWSEPITKDMNGFTCMAYKNTFIIGGRYIYELSESNNSLSILYQGATFFTGLHVISDTEIIAVGLDGKVYKTLNGGVNWQNINPGTSEDINDCYFFDADKGFVIGYNSFIKKTINGGSSWEDVSMQNIFVFEDILFTNDSTGFIGCGGDYVGGDLGYTWDFGYIYKTNNTGTSWESKLSTTTIVTSISFPNEKTGFAVTITGDAYKSTDYGDTWIKIIDSDSTAYGFNTVKFVNNMVGFIGGIDWQLNDCSANGALILKTIDGGDTWSIDYNECLSGNTINDIAFNDTIGIAITSSHIIPCTLY